MSTIETDRHLPIEADACQNCGAALTSGRYCSECGHRTRHSDAPSTMVDEPAAAFEMAARARRPLRDRRNGRPEGSVQSSTDQASGSGRARRARLVIAAALGAALVVAAVVVVVASVISKGGASDHTVFQHKVASVFRPVLGANSDLSHELARIHGARPIDAQAAVRAAQRASISATGALGAINVAAGSEQLAGDGRQVLDRETAYLAAVSDVLSNPSSSSRGELETLSSNLASAFSAAGPAVAGANPTASGADVLSAWAQRTARVLNKRARAKAARRDASSGQATAASTPAAGATTTSPATNPYAGGRDCEAGVFAGPNTSCDFAFNVRSAYLEAPGLTASVRVFSPTTGQTYTMDCAPSGSGTTCSGANDASVTF
jgi:hypothetical protein